MDTSTVQKEAVFLFANYTVKTGTELSAADLSLAVILGKHFHGNGLRACRAIVAQALKDDPEEAEKRLEWAAQAVCAMCN